MKDLYPEWDNIFHENKYTKWYICLCHRAKNRKRIFGEYLERHHVLPRSIGGSDDESNLVFLTAREHFIAHCFLPRMCKNTKDRQNLNWAITRMSSNCRGSSKIYAKEKERISREGISETRRKNIIDAHRTPEARIRKSNKMRSKWSEPEYRIAMVTAMRACYQDPDIRKRRAKSAKNFWANPENRAKMAEKLKNRVATEEAKRNMSIAQRSMPPVTCPHCNKSGKIGAMRRWHFDNCRHRQTPRGLRDAGQLNFVVYILRYL